MMRMWTISALVATLLMSMGCGNTEVRDRPEDCRGDEYFDEGRERCRTCPAVTEPECLPGCGFTVTEDNRGCPVRQGDPTCPGCDEGEEWDREEERCEPI
jgi:hypothetical protein